MSDSLSVEIFRDRICPKGVVGMGEKAVTLVNYFAKNLEIKRSDRILHLGEPSDTPLTAASVNWPRFDANLNLVITSRGITSYGQKALGVAIASAEPTKSVAIISAGELSPELTGAHELSHLLHFRDNTNLADPSHCQIDECLMNGTQALKRVTREVPRPKIHRTLRKERRQSYHTDSYETSAKRTFCLSCIEQLGQKAFYLASLYSGNGFARQRLEL